MRRERWTLILGIAATLVLLAVPFVTMWFINGPLADHIVRATDGRRDP